MDRSSRELRNPSGELAGEEEEGEFAFSVALCI